MTTVAGLSAKNAHNIAVENNKRGAAIVRVCGEEHAAISNGNAATFFLAHDNDMCFISDYKFKIILGTGGTGTNPNNPIPANVPRGTRLYSSVDAFIAQFPVGTAIDADGIYGAQCVDYASAFWLGMCDRFVDCGGNNAKGIWLNSWAVNKGTEFDSISSWVSLQKGDWIVWDTGTYGHIAMAAGAPSGNSIQVYNQNVSGIPWPDGGRAVSLDNRSNSGFLGAFRFKW